MSTSSTFIHLHSTADYTSLLQHSLQQPSQLVVLLFTAQWHEPSLDLVPVLQTLSQQYSYSTFNAAVIDAEQCDEVASKYTINSVPTVVFIRQGQTIDTLEGADATELSKRILKHERSAISTQLSQQQQQQSVEDLNTRLKRLINAEPVMCFIKGTPSAPRCGFTKRLLQLLADHHIQFGSFDILTDESVRQGLKEFNNWPTYPQVYIKGELIGGLDIIQEMEKSGELMQQIPPESIHADKGLHPDSSDSVESRCQKLIESNRVVLLMKGSPSAPACGFSATTVALLKEIAPDLSYTHFDVFSDNEVREYMKQKFQWPTYPMLIVDGELIGGLDIIQEMKQSGDLQNLLIKPASN